MAVLGLGIAGTVATIFSKIKRKSILKHFYKEGNYFRDTPNNGNIAVSHTLFNDFDIWKNKENNVIGAMIMKMINDKNLEPLRETTYGLFGNEKISTSLKVGASPSDHLIKELYDLIIVAAGEDGILQEKELSNYAKQNYEALNNFLDKILAEGHNRLNQTDCYTHINGNRLNDLTPKGISELSEVYGLRKFLDEFTLINERSLTEGIIWENLMVYATLFAHSSELQKKF